MRLEGSTIAGGGLLSSTTRLAYPTRVGDGDSLNSKGIDNRRWRAVVKNKQSSVLRRGERR